HVRQGIGVFDKNLELICWNRQFRRLVHLPVDMGRVGVPLEEILRVIAGNAEEASSDIERTVSDRINKLIVTMEPYQERLRSYGTVLEVRSDSLPDGGIVITFTDITERVQSAEALLRANETLERRVRERTAELTKLNTELATAKAKAEEADLGKTRFLAAASHDILQPLNAARLYTTSLTERSQAGDDGDMIRNVDASLEAVEDVLVALLDISRIDAGALKPEWSNFRIDQLMLALELEFGPIAREKGLTFKVVPSGLTVRSDRRLLRRVLQNFVSNAIKYTARGRVLMGCRRDGDILRIEVHDTGSGIAAGKQQLIFQEFQRLDTSGTGEPGIGLGLSIVERVAVMLKHRIGVRSEPARGSCFSIALPVAEPVSAEAFALSKPAPHAASLDGMTVLVIDNEPKILDGMRALFETWGCRVVQALDERTAEEAARGSGSTIDVIIADYHLDSADGLSLIETLRTLLDRNVPALLITADQDRSLQQRARDMQVSFMNKPVRPAALRATISRARIQTQAAE
ncbi:MAG: hybrid sensor histidine kinase/response regulator, partial [Hyphomicrobiales bacterium]